MACSIAGIIWPASLLVRTSSVNPDDCVCLAGKIDDRLRCLANGQIMRSFHKPHDLHVSASLREATADRILPGHVFGNESLVHDGYARRAFHIAIGEITAQQKRLIERGEIAGANRVKTGRDVGAVLYVAGDFDCA